MRNYQKGLYQLQVAPCYIRREHCALYPQNYNQVALGVSVPALKGKLCVEMKIGSVIWLSDQDWSQKRRCSAASVALEARHSQAVTRYAKGERDIGKASSGPGNFTVTSAVISAPVVKIHSLFSVISVKQSLFYHLFYTIIFL